MEINRALQKYTLVIPAHNEERFIGRVLPAAKEWQGHGIMTRNVVVVNDGGTDKTADIAREHGVPVIHSDPNSPQRNHGKSAAIRAGLNEAIRNGSDWVILADADLENLRKEHIDKLVNAARWGTHDMVIAKRAETGLLDEFMDVSPYNGERIIRVEKLKQWLTDPAWQKSLRGYGFEEGINRLITNHRYIDTDIKTARPPGAGAHGIPKITRDISRTRRVLGLESRKKAPHR